MERLKGGRRLKRRVVLDRGIKVGDGRRMEKVQVEGQTEAEVWNGGNGWVEGMGKEDLT